MAKWGHDHFVNCFIFDSYYQENQMVEIIAHEDILYSVSNWLIFVLNVFESWLINLHNWGFMAYQAVGDGTESGFGSLLLERLSADY